MAWADLGGGAATVCLGAISPAIPQWNWQGQPTSQDNWPLIRPLIKNHFRPVATDNITISERKFPFRVRADPQRAIDHLFSAGIGPARLASATAKGAVGFGLSWVFFGGRLGILGKALGDSDESHRLIKTQQSRYEPMVNRRHFLRSLASVTALAIPRYGLTGDKARNKVLERKSKPTLTPFGLNYQETLRFLRRNGEAWELTLLKTSAEVTQRNNEKITAYAFDCDVQINGKAHHLRRQVGTQASFYEPWEIDGVRVWFDAASCAFKEDGGFMLEKDWKMGLLCKPDHKARFAVQEADLPICPEPMHLWYPNDTERLDIRQCYNGEDCWMGPYEGKAAHCGLDINMKAGTTLFAPISFDDHYYFHSTAAGFNNNRWRGVRQWPDGSEWWLQSHHLIRMLVPEHTPVKAGTSYATTAGVAVGAHEHSHFMFRVLDQGGDYLLDPWILFWEMFRQQRGDKNGAG